MTEKAYIIHENDDWLAPLASALADRGIPYAAWHLGHGHRSLAGPAPRGVFYNRMSASSHTRGHRAGPEYAAALLEWLASTGARVINGARAVDLEISKARQYIALEQHGILVPQWSLAVDTRAVLAAAESIGYPVVVKPNRGGKGLGVRKYGGAPALEAARAPAGIDFGPDGVAIVQRYIAASHASIIRNEFVGGELVYAVRVDASNGFELCPAEACQPTESRQDEGGLCPVSGGAPFKIIPGFDHPNHDAYRRFLAANAIEVAGIEMVVDDAGTAWTYDVNTNTNYNPVAEIEAGLSGTDRSGVGAIARLLERELEALRSLSTKVSAAA